MRSPPFYTQTDKTSEKWKKLHSNLQASMSNLLEVPQDKHKVVEVILKATTLYQCVFVKNEATSVEIGKQFKKVSILCHPDKNDHPKSAEAFKRVGEAKRILTDDTSRRRYDQTGSTSDRPTSSQYYQSQGFGGGPGYAGTPEDFFNAFFAGHNTYSRRSGRPSGFSFFEDGSSFFEQPNGARFQQHNGFYRRTQPQPSAASAFAPFLGLIAIFLFVVLLNYIGRSGSTTSDPFTLWKTDEHNTPHFTSDGLPYWLSPGYYSSSTLLSEKHRKAMDNDVYNAWYRFRDRECAQDRSQTRRNFAQPAEPRSCHLFEELKSLKNRREW